jgi:hypothetical protein
MTSEDSMQKLEHPPSTVEWELFRENVNSMNESLRLEINIAAGLMAGCITLFNILPSPVKHTFLDTMDNYVFIPVLVSMAFAYRGLIYHWNYKKRKASPPDSVPELYHILAVKQDMLHIASTLLAISVVLLGVLVLLEFSGN